MPGDTKMKSIKIKLIKSTICTPDKHKVMVRALGLRTLNRTVTKPDTMFDFLKPHLKPVQAPHPPIGVAGLSKGSDTLKLAIRRSRACVNGRCRIRVVRSRALRGNGMSVQGGRHIGHCFSDFLTAGRARLRARGSRNPLSI